MKDKKENITIDEQDLFCYIFFPESVTGEKKDIIESDNSFGEILEFYRELKFNLDSKHDDALKKKIANKIPAYSLSNVIHLYQLKVPVKTKQNCNRLAAASTELKPKMTTKTFVDNDKEYLIKVLNYGETTKVFVFSTKDEIVKDFDIIIEPNNLKYHFEDNSEPLKIEQSIEADKIEIRFN
ncbi:MAG TPA: hypothetical protein PKD67_12185 [Ignavibacteriaceae bacterium]|nr:hypothetical protein [Ignavibacteriaceae bacterium]